MTAKKNRAIGGHQRAYEGISNCWLTPPHIVEALGPFDLDPCASINQPWKTAETQYTIEDDGFNKDWFGTVWMNPPYGPHTEKWLAKLADHGKGIALIFARTETSMFFDQVWSKAHAVLFIRGRLHFHYPNGTRAFANSGAPSVFVAYGDECATRLRETMLDGMFLWIQYNYSQPENVDIKTRMITESDSGPDLSS